MKDTLIKLTAIVLAALVIVAVVGLLLYIPSILLYMALTGFGVDVAFSAVLAAWGFFVIAYQVIKK